MEAIVYESNTGFSKEYAKILGSKLSVPVYSRKEAKQFLQKGTEIVYVAWLLAGTIKGFSNARKLYNIVAVCPVGMGFEDERQNKDLIKNYNLDPEKMFYLQGGFDITKLHGLYKFMMNTMKKAVGKKLAEKQDKTEAEIETLDLMVNGGNRVDEKNLVAVLKYLGK